MKFKVLVLLLVTIGCSSTPEKGEQDPLLGGLSDSDFAQPQLVPYREGSDKFPLKDKNLLGDESLFRLDRSNLDDNDFAQEPLSDAINFCYKKEYAQGFKILDSIFRRYKKHPNYWNQIGSCYFLQGNDQAAILYYNQALDLNGRYAPPLNNMGVLNVRKGRPQEALAYFQKAAKYSPFSKTPIFNLAHLYLKFGFVEKAIKYFNVLERKFKFDVDVISGLGNAYMLKGDYNRSIEYFNQIDDRDLKRPDISLNYALALKMNRNTGGAKEVLDKISKDKLAKYSRYYKKVKKLVGY
jgi:tetratricopeptide (TPR) repeat protein